MTTTISNSDDYIDVRDMIERYEELETVRDSATTDDPLDEDDDAEMTMLGALLEELAGNGGDHEWKGVWYPVSLIRDSHFEDYARDLAEDIGAIDPKAGWPLGCIDWEQAATELQQDYSTVEFDGVTYWYR